MGLKGAIRFTIIMRNIYLFNKNIISADLKEDHCRQIGGKAEQDIVGDKEQTLYHNDRLIPQEVRKKEHWEKEGKIGIRPNREQVIGHL